LKERANNVSNMQGMVFERFYFADSLANTLSFPLVGNHFFQRDCGQAAMTETDLQMHYTYEHIGQ